MPNAASISIIAPGFDMAAAIWPLNVRGKYSLKKFPVHWQVGKRNLTVLVSMRVALVVSSCDKPITHLTLSSRKGRKTNRFASVGQLTIKGNPSGNGGRAKARGLVLRDKLAGPPNERTKSSCVSFTRPAPSRGGGSPFFLQSPWRNPAAPDHRKEQQPAPEMGRAAVIRL